MNISRHTFKIFSFVLLFCGSFSAAFAQGGTQPAYTELETVKNETVDFVFFNSSNYPVTVDEYPAHGSIETFGPPNNYGEWTLIYQPDWDYVGTDDVVIKYREGGFFGYWVEMHLHIKIIPAYIKALDDFATVRTGESVEIDVLANDDWTGSDPVHVEEVTLVNSGVGYCTDASCGSITFVPDADFTGIAHINYTICDDDNNCDDAIVNISVTPTVEPVTDSLFIITSRDISKVVLFDLAGYGLGADTPAHGTVGFDEVQSVPTYTPQEGFAGYDDFTYTKLESNIFYTRYVRVHVLNTPVPNEFLLDDHAYTSAGVPITIDVAANDKVTPSSYYVPQNGEHGIAQPVVIEGTIQFQYTPFDINYTGTDTFKYRAYVGPGQQETATVTVHINNQVPAQPVFTLTTVKNVPLVIDYGIPIESYSFTLTGTGAEYGSAQIIPGFSTQTWNGQSASGYNLIVYTPDAGFAGQDEFEVEYATDLSLGNLATVKIIVNVLDITPVEEQLCIGDNCVWPGDTNHDGIVNMADVLPIGLCMGETGQGRYTETTGADWYGQYGTNWNDPFETPGFDLKHIDTDGDSIIANADTAAIRAHYGEIHNLIPVPENPTPLPIYLKYDGGNPQPGDLVTFDIYLGDSIANTDYALDIHGITSVLNYDPDFVQEGSMQITFPEDTWMSYDAPTLGMSYDMPAQGQIDFAFTRTNGVSVDGYGKIASVNFIVIEDLVDFRPGEEAYFTLPFNLTGTGVMNGAGGTYTLADTDTTIPVHIPAADEKTTVVSEDLKVFPNPTNNVINLYLNGYGNEVESYEIYDIAGRMLHSDTIAAKSATVDVAAWNAGTYILRVVTVSGEVLNAKFEVAK